MAKKVKKINMVVKQDENGVLTVRIVGQVDDGTHPYGDVTAKLTNGEKTALKNMLSKIIADLEK